MIKSWEMVCDSVEQLVTKCQKLCARHWMLADELMEMLNMAVFDELVVSDPTNL